ncbi:hypothetical protein LCGC14_2127420 [marine sediment metagenome]|uniref:AP2/ERF domain-containing protein n=1 Tax=marine sediment metagenome TaxID=412755 RepID=A0A0F9GFH6_9ZZZZ
MRGVWYDPKRELYRAACEHKGKSVFIGRYLTEKEAGLAYDQKAIELWGDKAKLNFGDWNRSTSLQLKCYKLCSPDFDGLTQEQAGAILGVSAPTIFKALRGLQKKCPDIFPIYQRKPKTQRYEDWVVAK